MKTKFLSNFAKVAIATFRWLGFIIFETILTGFNLLILASILFYLNYVFGPTPRIEPKRQDVSIKKVDGFYLIQGEQYQQYDESTFPDCKIKFYNKELEFKKGDIYDGNKCITDKVSIQWTKGGFRVYYLKKSYPLTTLTNIDGDYNSGWSIKPEKREMYAKGGIFYTDIDNRHGFLYFMLLCLVIVLLLYFRYGAVDLTRNLFYREFNAIYDFRIHTKSYLKAKIEKMKKKKKKKED